MADLSELIPAALMLPDRKRDVIIWLKGTTLSAFDRRRILQAWGRKLGVELTHEDYVEVSL